MFCSFILDEGFLIVFIVAGSRGRQRGMLNALEVVKVISEAITNFFLAN